MAPDTSRNPKLLCAFQALHMSLFPMAILTLFYKREIGMSLRDIYVLQAIFGLFVALFEFPSGYLADRLGYRRTLVIAALGNVVGWSLYSAATTFTGVVVAEAVLGVSLSLISGADAALLFESLVADGRQGEFTRWSGRMKFWGQTGEGTAALLAGVMFSLHPRVPFVVEAFVWIAALAVAWRLVEPHLEARQEQREDHLHAVREMVRTAFVTNVRLRALILLTIVMGMSTFVPVWFISIYAAENGLPDGWQGVLWAAANYAVALGALSSDAVRRRWGFVAAMVGCILLVFAGYLSLAVVQGVATGFLYVMMALARGVFAPILGHLEQDELASGDRAGFVSLRSLVFRGSFLVIAPLIGLAFEVYGMRPVILALGVAFALLGGLTLRGVLRADRAAASS